MFVSLYRYWFQFQFDQPGFPQLPQVGSQLRTFDACGVGFYRLRMDASAMAQRSVIGLCYKGLTVRGTRSLLIQLSLLGGLGRC